MEALRDSSYLFHVLTSSDSPKWGKEDYSPLAALKEVQVFV